MEARGTARKVIRGLLIGAGVIVGAAVLAAVCLVIWLTAAEYKPAGVEFVSVEGEASGTLREGDEFTVMTWNIGYGALGDNADFFMDGGTGVYTADETRVRENLTAVIAEIDENAPDAVFLQEADRDSARSRYIDEAAEIAASQTGKQSSFAYNYRCGFVPYPVPPIGRVNGGLLTLSSYAISEARRIQLPCPFSWPVRAVNLKRCLLVDRIPLESGGSELVLVNLHLEAYDSGEGKAAQTEMLREILQAEADAGNYVIAGGDFNQILSSIENPWPSGDGFWQPGELDVDAFSDGWQFVMDESTPSCRSLDRPYTGEAGDDFQYYLIDGFIVSGGLEIISVQTHDLGFVNSDHNPVYLTVRLPAE